MELNIATIPEQKTVNGLAFPLVITPHNDEVARDPAAFDDWVHQHRDDLKALLIKHGALLFRGFPVSNADAFEHHLDQTSFKNMPYVGGAAPRNQVTQSRIVTANESPASETIPFHHEMAQTPNPPGYIFFYCDIPSPVGGATSILHSGEIYRRFAEISPEVARKIEEQGVRYIRVMPEETDNNSAIGRSWKETFQVQTRDDAERVMRDAWMSWEWLDNGNLRTESRILPAIRYDAEIDQKVFFNALIAVYTGWNDSRNDGEKAVVTGDGKPMDPEVMKATAEAMDELCVNFKWQKNDVLWVSNYTVLHARQPYEGDRRILASIAYK